MSDLKYSITFVAVAILIVGFVFFRMVQPFVLPLIFSCVFATLAWPLKLRMTGWCRGHDRIASALTTAVVMLLFLLPLGGGISLAGMQMLNLTEHWNGQLKLPDEAEELIGVETGAEQRQQLREIRSRFTDQEWAQLKRMTSTAVSSTAQSIYDRTMNIVVNVVAVLIGVVVMALGLYYFLADNESILDEVWRLSPLSRQDDEELSETFSRVCRGILLGNVLAAAVQAILNGVGLAVAGMEGVWILTLLTFFCSFIPFIGAAAVWGAAGVFLIFQQRYLAGFGVLAYGMLVVSTVDNLVRAYAIRDRARMHPLVALIAIVGAVQLVGLWGIVVGPVVAAFLYALLDILSRNLRRDADRTAISATGSVPTNASEHTPSSKPAGGPGSPASARH